jgi:hypothetical protein
MVEVLVGGGLQRELVGNCVEAGFNALDEGSVNREDL